MRERVAVVGAGVSGLTAAYLLQRRYDVTLFEAEGRLGGHAHTHELDTVAVDSGFIVHNDVTYPNLLRLFAELGVATQDSEMSMSVRDEATGLEYAGARGLEGPVRPAAQPREPALPADARRGPALPPPGPRGGGRDVAARRGRHLRRVPRRRRLLAVLRRDLRGARGVRGLVVGAGALAAVPGALPVHVPREPRDALGRRLAPLAHRRRRLAHLRRARREGPVGGGGVDAGARRGRARATRCASATTPTSSAASTASSSPPTPRTRCACSSRRPPSRCRCSGPSATRATRPCCTPTPRCCPRAEGARASWNLLRVPGESQVLVSYDMTRLMRLPEPARDLRRHPQRDRPDRPRHGHRAHGLRAPRLHPGVGRGTAPAAGAERRPARLRRRVPRLGLPRGRLRLGGARRAALGVTW